MIFFKHLQKNVHKVWYMCVLNIDISNIMDMLKWAEILNLLTLDLVCLLNSRYGSYVRLNAHVHLSLEWMNSTTKKDFMFFEIYSSI